MIDNTRVDTLEHLFLFEETAKRHSERYIIKALSKKKTFPTYRTTYWDVHCTLKVIKNMIAFLNGMVNRRMKRGSSSNFYDTIKPYLQNNKVTFETLLVDLEFKGGRIWNSAMTNGAWNHMKEYAQNAVKLCKYYHTKLKDQYNCFNVEQTIFDSWKSLVKNEISDNLKDLLNFGEKLKLEANNENSSDVIDILNSCYLVLFKIESKLTANIEHKMSDIIDKVVSVIKDLANYDKFEITFNIQLLCSQVKDLMKMCGGHRVGQIGDICQKIDSLSDWNDKDYIKQLTRYDIVGLQKQIKKMKEMDNSCLSIIKIK